MITIQRPLLQLAVDALSTKQGLEILGKVHPHCDIVEVGTPLLIEEGLAALETLKAEYPDKFHLADVKIMDAGNIEAKSAFKRGADIVTVLAAADNQTVVGALDAAREFDGTIMADLINVPKIADRAGELEQLGVPIVCVHTAFDRRKTGVNPLEELQKVRKAVRCKVAVAGGLNFETVGPAVAAGADIVVVGGGIINQPSPREAAEKIMRKLQEAKRR